MLHKKFWRFARSLPAAGYLEQADRAEREARRERRRRSEPAGVPPPTAPSPLLLAAMKSVACLLGLVATAMAGAPDYNCTEQGADAFKTYKLSNSKGARGRAWSAPWSARSCRSIASPEPASDRPLPPPHARGPGRHGGVADTVRGYTHAPARAGRERHDARRGARYGVAPASAPRRPAISTAPAPWRTPRPRPVRRPPAARRGHADGRRPS